MITNKQIEFYKTNGYVKGIKIIDDHDKVDRLRKAVIDILSFRLFILKKVDKKLLDLVYQFKSKVLPIMPIVAKDLMEKYNIPEGKDLGNKLKMIEEKWVNNNFELSKEQVDKIISH